MNSKTGVPKPNVDDPIVGTVEVNKNLFYWIIEEFEVSFPEIEEYKERPFFSRRSEEFWSGFMQESGRLVARRFLNTDNKDNLLADNKDNLLVIRFDTNSYQLNDSGYENLETFCSQIGKNNKSQIKITGYADTTGSENYNFELSRKRANYVKGVFNNICDTYSGELTTEYAGENNPPIPTEDNISEPENRSVKLRQLPNN